MFGKDVAEGEFCPLLKAGCIKQACKFWIHIRGAHPQTGAQLDMPDCSVKWLPVLLIEATQQTRQAGAAIESFRNEMVKINGSNPIKLLS